MMKRTASIDGCWLKYLQLLEAAAPLHDVSGLLRKFNSLGPDTVSCIYINHSDRLAAILTKSES